MADATLTPTQTKTLKAVTKRPLTGPEIAEKVGVTPRGVNRNLGILTRLGLIATDKKNGRRVYSKI